jgi:hypothetical protein
MWSKLVQVDADRGSVAVSLTAKQGGKNRENGRKMRRRIYQEKQIFTKYLYIYYENHEYYDIIAARSRKKAAQVRRDDNKSNTLKPPSYYQNRTVSISAGDRNAISGIKVNYWRDC